MGSPISIRDPRTLVKILKEGKEIPMDDEMRHNSFILKQILGYAPRVLPSFSGLSEMQVKTIADSVSYLLRPDMVYAGQEMYLHAMQYGVRKLYIEDGFQIHLRNDPSILTPDFDMAISPCRDEIGNSGAEFFRCYSTMLKSMPGVLDILSPSSSHIPAFKLSDMTAFLLTPSDLFDYTYSLQEKESFERRILARQGN